MDEKVFTVNLVKRKLGGFGFLVKPRSSNPPAVISHIVKGGVAEENGLLKPGDIIFKVNGTSLTESTYQHSVDLLTKLPVGKSASITVTGPDSIRSTLETTFSTSGNTKTIRITDARSKKLEAEIQETEFEENVKNSTSNIIYTQAQINGTLPVNGNAKTILIDKNGVDHEADRSKGKGLQNGNLSLNGNSNKTDQPESLADLLIRQNGDIKSKSTIDSLDTTGHPCSGLESIKAGLEQKGKPPSPEKSPTLASLVKKKTKYVRLRNLINGTQLVDTLHQQALVRSYKYLSSVLLLCDTWTLKIFNCRNNRANPM